MVPIPKSAILFYSTTSHIHYNDDDDKRRPVSSPTTHHWPFQFSSLQCNIIESTRWTVNETPTRPTLFRPFLFIDELGGGWFCLLLPPPLGPITNYPLYTAEYRETLPATTPQAEHCRPLFDYSCSEIRVTRMRSLEYRTQLPADLDTIGIIPPTAAVLYSVRRLFRPPFTTRRCTSSSVAVEKILAKCRLTTIPSVTRSWTFGLRHKVGSGV